jgi:hypothetical protein
MARTATGSRKRPSERSEAPDLNSSYNPHGGGEKRSPLTLDHDAHWLAGSTVRLFCTESAPPLRRCAKPVRSSTGSSTWTIPPTVHRAISEQGSCEAERLRRLYAVRWRLQLWHRTAHAVRAREIYRPFHAAAERPRRGPRVNTLMSSAFTLALLPRHGPDDLVFDTANE